MLTGCTIFKTSFNVDGIEIIGSIKYSSIESFMEIKYVRNDRVYTEQKIYNGDINNESQMISEMENFIDEFLNVSK